MRTIESERIEAFLQFLKYCKDELEFCDLAEQRCDEETQDILHQMELFENSTFDFTMLGLTLRQVRQERRRAKNKAEMLKPIVEWAIRNKATIDSLKRLQRDVKVVERTIQRRKYTFRTDVVREALEDNDE